MCRLGKSHSIAKVTLAKPPTFMMHALDEVSYLRDTINAKTKIRDKDEPALFFR